MNGKKVSTVELSDAVFGITRTRRYVHEAVVNFLANQRQGTQNTKIREVAAAARSLGARRHRPRSSGLYLSPQCTHGGVAQPKPRNYYYTINKKVKVWLCSAPCLTRLPTAT